MLLGKPLFFAGANNPGAGSYNIGHSVRFDGPTTHFHTTQGSCQDPYRWSCSAWIKRSGLHAQSDVQPIFGARDGTGTFIGFYPGGSSQDRIALVHNNVLKAYTNRLLRDVSSHYHILAVYDSQNLVITDRFIIYVNGERSDVTWSDNVTLNEVGVSPIFGPTTYSLGYQSTLNKGFYGYMSEAQFLDGTVATPDMFGYKNEITGQWLPKSFNPHVNYGNVLRPGSSVTITGSIVVGTSATTHDKLTDSNFEWDYARNAATTSGAEWKVNLGGVKTIRKLRIFGNDSTKNISSWKLQYSSDDITYLDAATLTVSPLDWSEVSFAPISARYWKIIPNSNGADTNTFGFREVELHGTLGHGNLGFYLDFATGTSTTTLGYDNAPATDGAGGSNNFTSVGFVRTGSDDCWTTDTPTNNLPTLNPLVVNDPSSAMTITNGNLNATLGGAHGRLAWSTMGMKRGEWYAEFTLDTVNNNAQLCGIIPLKSTLVYRNTSNTYVGSLLDEVGYGRVQEPSAGGPLEYIMRNAVTVQTIHTSIANIPAGTVIGVAYDGNTRSVQFYKNGVASGAPVTNLLDEEYFFAVSGAVTDWICNFGQRPFTPPAGYVGLCSSRLEVPAILNPKQHFDVKTYTGNGSSLQIGNDYSYDIENPDLVWIKGNNGTFNHMIFDSMRGVGEYLSSNNQSGQTYDATSLTQFNKNGFLLGSNTHVNTISEKFTAWLWKAGTADWFTAYKLSVRACTINDSTDFITLDAPYSTHYLEDGQGLQFQHTGGSLPTGISGTTVYYIVNKTSTTFQISTSPGGSPFNFTDTGTNVRCQFLALVSINQAAGFSITKYAGDCVEGGSSAPMNIPHGLGRVPDLVIVKSINATSQRWPVKHSSMPDGYSSALDSTTGASYTTGTSGGVLYDFASTTTFATWQGSGDEWGEVSRLGRNYIAYCFTEVPGFSKFDSYAGSNSADGTFVYCGFRPKYVLIKSTTDGRSWVIADSVRDPNNLVIDRLFTNLASHDTNGAIDFVSNGFKLRTNDANVNAYETYIFAAFAETPFKYANAR